MKKIGKNILYNLAYQILAIILPLITAPYLSRVIGPTGVGIYSFSHSVALYFTYFTLLGLTNYGNRAIAAVQADIEERSKQFCEIYAMQLLCFAGSMLAYLLYSFFLSKDITAALLMILTVASSALDINWFFFGMEEFKLTVIRNAIIKIISFISIFVFVRDSGDIYIYIAIMSVSALLSQILLWPFLRNRIRFRMPTWKGIVRHFKPNLILFVPVIAVSVYKLMDKLFLGYMAAMDQVGFYENAERIITIAATVITAIGTVMLPRMSSMKANNLEAESNRYLDNTMLGVLAYTNAVMFGIFAVANEFAVTYYGNDFKQTGVLMCYLAVTVLFLGCGNVVRTQYLIPQKRDGIYLRSAILGAVVNCVLNSILIPLLSSTGAAIGTICAEFAVCFYQMYAVRQALHIRRYLRWECVFGLIGGIMYFVVRSIPHIGTNTTSLLIHIVSGAAVYLALAGVYVFKIEHVEIPALNKLLKKQ